MRIFLLLVLTAISTNLIKGQIVFTSIPDSTAPVNELYSYDVEAAFAPDAPVFSLQDSPEGMDINSSTGLIQWTPSDLSQGGKVTVKAVNSYGSFFQTYYIYVSDEVVCPQGLLNYWKLDGPVDSGDSLPDYANDNSAVALSTMTDTEGKLNRGLIFSSSNKFQKYLYVIDEDQYDHWTRASDFSFSLWFRHVGSYTGNDECFITRGEGDNGARLILGIDYITQRAVFRVKTNKSLQEAFVDTLSVFTTPFSNNQWHHLAAVYDGNADSMQSVSISLYLDGVKFTNSGNLDVDYNFSMNSTQNLNIGWFSTYATTNSFPFNGYMDEVSVFDKLLTDEDVSEIYNSGQPISFCGPGNYTPLVTSVPTTGATKDSSYSYTLTIRDYENDEIEVTVVTKPDWLVFDSSTNTLSGTPSSADVGDSQVSLLISDGKAEVSHDYTLSVANINSIPVITSGQPPSSVILEEIYSYTIEASDADAGDSLVYSAPVLPAWLSFDDETRLLSGVLTRRIFDSLGTDQYDVTLRVTDSYSAVAELSFVITANESGMSITSTPGDSILAGELYSYTFTATGQENDTLTFSAVNIPAWLTFEAETGLLSGTPDISFAGANEVALSVTNGRDTLEHAFTITVYSLSGIDEYLSNDKLILNMYPVPVSDNLIFELNNVSGATIVIFDLSGKSLKKEVLPGNKNKIFVDMTDLPSGMYLFKIFNDKYVQTGKIFKE